MKIPTGGGRNCRPSSARYARETKGGINREDEAQRTEGEHANADTPVEHRTAGRRDDLGGGILRRVLEGPALEVAISELREDNAEDEKERRYDWT